MATIRGERRDLEIVVLHPADAERAQEGGADRLHVCRFDGDQALSVEPAQLSAILRVTDLPVRVTLRLSPGFTTQGGEFTRLIGLASDYLALGAEGIVFGFLTPDLEVDLEVCAELGDALAGAPWTFDRAFDHVLDPGRAWRRLSSSDPSPSPTSAAGPSGLPGLDRIHTAGAGRGMDAGLDDLVRLASSDPAFAATAVAAGGVRPEHVPWLARAGVQRLHLGSSVRPGGSWSKSYVDAGFVRSWRLLLDDAVGAGLSEATGSVG